jgi:site-specific recombinase XerD
VPARRHDFYTDRWMKIRDMARENGLPRRMTMHGLRHSMLTLLATEGVDLAALREMAGHKSITTTFDVYVHSTRKHHEPVRQIVGDFLGGMNAAAEGSAA